MTVLSKVSSFDVVVVLVLFCFFFFFPFFFLFFRVRRLSPQLWRAVLMTFWCFGFGKNFFFFFSFSDDPKPDVEL